MIECKYSHFDKIAAQHFTAYGTLRSALLHCLRNVDRQFFTKCKYLHSIPEFHCLNDFFKRRAFYIILNRRNLEICKHSSFLIIDEIVF